MITVGAMMVAASLAWQAIPERSTTGVDRDSFTLFPRSLGEWRQEGPPRRLSPDIVANLGADDYHSINLRRAGEPEVEFFSAWYNDQSKGGVHSPEICLPGGGWEIAWLERTDMTEFMGSEQTFNINRAIIQKGETRMMVYYWFEQKGRKIAWDMAAKYWLLVDGVRTGRTDGALVRLTTLIQPGEADSNAEARLRSVMKEVTDVLPRFIPEI
jgi:EpsI family protein